MSGVSSVKSNEIKTTASANEGSLTESSLRYKPLLAQHWFGNNKIKTILNIIFNVGNDGITLN
jgi:hypothetical protein